MSAGSQIAARARSKAKSKTAKKVVASSDIKDAQEILNKIDTPEKAIALKGAEREEYLKALESVYGTKSERAKSMDIDLPAIEKAHKKADKAKDKFDFYDSTHSTPIFDEAGELVDETYIGPRVEAVTKGNKQAGEVPFKDHGDHISVDDRYSDLENQVFVQPEFRRQGVAENMYREAERASGLPAKPSTWQTDDGEKLWGDKDTVRAFGNKRVPDAAFDPRFKDSSLIMSLNKSPSGQAHEAMKNAPQQLTDAVGEALDYTAIPQRYMMRKLAESMNVEAGETSEESAQNIVEKAAAKMGIPDNDAGNAAKAGAVAFMEVLGDPTSLVPAGSIKKAGSAIQKAVSKSRSAAPEIAKAIKPVGRVKPPEHRIKTGAESFTGQYYKAEKQKSDAKRLAGKFIPERNYNKVGATEFSEAVQKARNTSNMHKANVTPYSKDQYKNMRTYLSADGKSGYAVKKDTGEWVSLFSTERGRGKDMTRDASINRGAEILDAYDIENKLPKLYGETFDETSRMKFDPKYAPEGYDPATMGTPDVVMMNKSPEKVIKFMEEQDALKAADPTQKSTTIKKWERAE